MKNEHLKGSNKDLNGNYSKEDKKKIMENISYIPSSHAKDFNYAISKAKNSIKREISEEYKRQINEREHQVKLNKIMDKEEANIENENILKQILQEKEFKHETRNHITKLFNPFHQQKTIDLNSEDPVLKHNLKPFSIRGFYNTKGSIEISSLNKNKLTLEGINNLSNQAQDSAYSFKLLPRDFNQATIWREALRKETYEGLAFQIRKNQDKYGKKEKDKDFNNPNEFLYLPDQKFLTNEKLKKQRELKSILEHQISQKQLEEGNKSDIKKNTFLTKEEVNKEGLIPGIYNIPSVGSKPTCHGNSLVKCGTYLLSSHFMNPIKNNEWNSNIYNHEKAKERIFSPN